MMNISTTLFGEISHASLFFTGQLRNPWQIRVEPQLKNTGVHQGSCLSPLPFIIVMDAVSEYVQHDVPWDML